MLQKAAGAVGQNYLTKGGQVCAMLQQFAPEVEKAAKPELKPPEPAGDSEPKPDSSVAKTDGEPKASADVLEFVIGEIVTAVSGKAKDRYHQKRAKVTQVLSKTLRVDFLEGPAHGEIKDFQKDRIEKIPSEPVPAEKNETAQAAEPG